MKFWLSHIRNLETFVANYRMLLDVWESAGVDGLVVGPMVFDSRQRLAHSRGRLMFRDGTAVRAAFDPDPGIYRAMGVTPPSRSATDDTSLRADLAQAMRATVERGWSLWLFDPFTGVSGPDLNDNAARIIDEETRAAFAARMIDTIQAFPMASGVVIDGPAWGFEIADLDIHELEERRRIFELPGSSSAVANLGYDLDSLAAAQESLQSWLHSLTSDRVRAHIDRRDDSAPEVAGYAEWLRFRMDALVSLYEYMRDKLKAATGASTGLAVCPRTPAIGPMAGYDYDRISHIVDMVMPKSYFWHRGYDGLVGTAWRWAATLTKWNPGISVRDACHVTRMFFGDAIPVVDSLYDFDMLITPDYLEALTASETRRAVAAVDGRAQVVPWIDSGRAPHDGDPLTAAHLAAMLRATKDAGVDRFLYYSSTNVSAADWSVLSRYCGQQWRPESTPDWYPPDQPTL